MSGRTRVWCFDVGCNCCSRGTLVGQSITGKNLYSCSVLENRHKKIDGRDCGAFRCNRHINACKIGECRRGE